MRLWRCDSFELSPLRTHGDPCGGTGRPAEERTLGPLPVASAQMPSPTARGTEQEPSPVTSEQMLLPVAPGKKQEPSPVASEQMPSPACNGFELLPTALEQMPSPVSDGSEPS